MREHPEVGGKLEPAQITHCADDEQHRVEADAAGPAQGRSQRDQLQRVEMFHANAAFFYSPLGTHAALRLPRKAATPSLPSGDARTRAIRLAVSEMMRTSIGRCA